MTTKTPTLYSDSKPKPPARTCLCSPTNHPGSFRCGRHRSLDKVSSRRGSWELAVVAKSNSVMAFLRLMIRPSNRDHQRRRDFQLKRSRFCLLNGNENTLPVVY
ncbi:hypothetical protein R6Q57_029146 [Mikania cordata]